MRPSTASTLTVRAADRTQGELECECDCTRLGVQVVAQHRDELRLDWQLLREHLQVVRQLGVNGDDDSLAARVKLRAA